LNVPAVPISRDGEWAGLGGSIGVE
jgi:hypothetical protein